MTGFHLPVAADGGQEFRWSDRVGIETGNEVAALGLEDFALGRVQLAVDAEGNSTIREVQAVADIDGVVQVDPKSADFAHSPFFSAISATGQPSEASAKQAFKASSTSGWFALT